MYKLGMTVMRVVFLTLAVASALSYVFEGESERTYFLAVIAAFAFIMMMIAWGEHRSKLKNAPASPVSLFEHENQAGSLALVRRRPERPVMFYKGEVYDFVHHDPTAPDMA